MVYGEQLSLPSEFFATMGGNWTADADFVVNLRQKIRQVRPVAPVWHGGESRRTFVPQELSTATHVFVRVGAHRTSLHPPFQSTGAT